GARTPWQFFTDHAEPELVEAIRRGRAEEFRGHGWDQIHGGPVDVPDPQSPATVAASRLDWGEPHRPEHARVLRWYRDLVALRRAEPDLATGDLAATRVEHDEAAGWVVVHRGALRVVVVLARRPTRVPLDGPADVVLAWADEDVAVTGDGLTATGRTVAVLRRTA